MITIDIELNPTYLYNSRQQVLVRSHLTRMYSRISLIRKIIALLVTLRYRSVNGRIVK